MTGKEKLRKSIRIQKSLHSEEALVGMSENVCRSVLQHPVVRRASTLVLYWALSDEVRTEGLIKQLVAEGKAVLLPRVVSDTEMTIHRFTTKADLSVGAYGILEPTGERVETAELQRLADSAAAEGGDLVVVVPGMAFDRTGHRLGRGKGYYDRFLSKVPGAYKIGICFPFQLVPVVPTEAQDVTMDEVIWQ